MAIFYGHYKTKQGTWRTTGPHGDYERAEQTAEFFAYDREFKVISETEFLKLLKKGEISAT